MSVDAQQAGLPSIRAGDVVAGYRIVEFIDGGGMGNVYRAWDQRHERYVAIKAPKLDAGVTELARRRFLRETRVASRVSHPFVATVYEVTEDKGQPLLVMEYIDGKTVEDLVDGHPIPMREVTRYAVEIAEALAAIHSQGIVHRDLKPRNVMITKAGHVKVMDFGVAMEALTGPGESSTLTGLGHAVGTINYMSPEQVSGRKIDARSDLFSLGILLYEAITGEHPFARPSAVAVGSAIVSDAPGGGSLPATLTQTGPMRHVVMKLLEKDPAARYDSAEDLLDDLRAVEHGEELPSFLKASTEPTTSWPRLALVAALGVAAIFAVVKWGPRPGPVTPKARPVVAILPFEDGNHDLDGDLRGEMLTELLTADLGDSPVARSLPMQRVQDALVSVGAPRNRQREIESIRANAKVDWIVAGTVFGQGDALTAALEVFAPGATDPRTYRVSAAGSIALVDVAAAQIRKVIAPNADGGGGTSAALTSTNDEARLLEQRGRRAWREFRYDDALRFLEDAVRLDPAFLSAWIALAECADRSGYGRKAKEAAETAMRLSAAPGTAISERLRLQSKAAFARVNDRLDEEVGYRRQLSERFPDEPAILVALSAVFPKTRAAEAIPVAERALALDPQDARAHLQHAKLLAYLERFDDAVAEIESVPTLVPTTSSAYVAGDVEMALGRIEFSRKKYPEAARRFDAAAAAYRGVGQVPLEANAIKSWADMVLLMGKTDDAKAAYEKVYRVTSSFGHHRIALSAITGLGSQLFATGQYAEAERSLRRAIDDAARLENDGLLLAPLITFANLEAVLGHPAESRAAAQRALDAAPGLSGTTEEQARICLADADYQEGRLQDAATAYRAILARNPSGGAGYAQLSLAEVLEASEHLEEALALLDSAVKKFEASNSQLMALEAKVRRASVNAQLARFEASETDLAAVEHGAAADAAGTALRSRCALVRTRACLFRGDAARATKLLDSVSDRAESTPDITLSSTWRAARCEAAAMAGSRVAPAGECPPRWRTEPVLPNQRASIGVAQLTLLARGSGPGPGDALTAAVLRDIKTADAPMLEARAHVALARRATSAAERDAALRLASEAAARFLTRIPRSSEDAVKRRADVAAVLVAVQRHSSSKP